MVDYCTGGSQINAHTVFTAESGKEMTMTIDSLSDSELLKLLVAFRGVPYYWGGVVPADRLPDLDPDYAAGLRPGFGVYFSAWASGFESDFGEQCAFHYPDLRSAILAALRFYFDRGPVGAPRWAVLDLKTAAEWGVSHPVEWLALAPES